MKPEKQLSVRSSEAAELAAQLARSTGKPQKQVVVEALRLLHQQQGAGRVQSSKAKSAKIARFEEALRQLHEEIRRIEEETGEKFSSDHSWMYDENGLPK
jgi:hypothetical protein